MKSNKFIEALKSNKMAKIGKVITKTKPVVSDEDLNLTELRMKYPHVKSNSKAGFINKLKENGILN